MDVHSRLSQFNSRRPKAGPIHLNSRYMEAKPLHLADGHAKQRSASFNQSLSTPTPRPIATNSRVKQDEKYRKDMYLAFVNNAFQEKAKGNGDAFDELVDQFNPTKMSNDAGFPAAQLRHWFSALSHVVSQLERSHSALVDAIVNLPWTIMDASVVKLYVSFIGILVSARPEYLSKVLDKTTRGLTYQSGLQALDSRVAEGSSSPLTRRVVYNRLHQLLQHLLALVPTLPSTLQPLLVRSFPHKRQSQVAQVTYISNLLRVSEYCPELSDRILATIVDRAIQVDVEIQVELEELEAIEAATDSNDIFELDPFDAIVGQDGSDSETDSVNEDDNLSDLSSDAGDNDGEEQGDVQTNVHHVQDMVAKLDSILKLVFDHFSRIHTFAASTDIPSASTPLSTIGSPNLDSPRTSSPISAELEKELRRSQFHALLSIFDHSIIRTFKSRYTQFLVFWYSSLDPEFSDLFQGLLISKALLEEDQPVVTRAAAASYIASFVSRANFVDRDSARRVVGILCDFLRNHLDIVDAFTLAGSSSPGITHHNVFYAVAQAVFLIFCFRWRDLMEEEDDADEFSSPSRSGATKKWIAQLSVMSRVVTSSLNPLKICSTNVVMQFARVARSTGFVYCYSIMEANKRSDYAPSLSSPRPQDHYPFPRQSSLQFMPVVRSDLINAELNTFFPFDPYRLPKSNSYIQGVYREWASVAIDDGDEENDEDEEGEDDVDDVPITVRDDPMSNGLGSSVDDGLGVSFGGMSISPIHPAALGFAS